MASLAIAVLILVGWVTTLVRTVAMGRFAEGRTRKRLVLMLILYPWASVDGVVWLIGRRLRARTVAPKPDVVEAAPDIHPVAVANDWSGWKPGSDEAAELMRPDGRGSGLRRLLRTAAPSVKSYFKVFSIEQLDAISEACASGASCGAGVREISKSIRSLLTAATDADQVVNTAMSLLSNAVTLRGIKRDGFSTVTVQTAGDEQVCSECRELEDAGSILIQNSPRLPLHPGCGCQLLAGDLS